MCFVFGVNCFASYGPAIVCVCVCVYTGHGVHVQRHAGWGVFTFHISCQKVSCVLIRNSSVLGSAVAIG